MLSPLEIIPVAQAPVSLCCRMAAIRPRIVECDSDRRFSRLVQPGLQRNGNDSSRLWRGLEQTAFN